MSSFVSGVYAAVLTPRLANNSVDVTALRKLLNFLLSKGVKGFALNGATGEFCLTTPDDLETLLQVAQEICGGNADLLCGVGAAGLHGSIAFASIAAKHGVNALLLPMPYFFPYQQQDLDAFCREVASTTDLPILLYNLPQFTSGLEPGTVRKLITEVSNIIGIKDSSGSLEIMRDLTSHGVQAGRIVGNDSALAPALMEGVCDGVVSGVACALPELVLSLYEEALRPYGSAFQQSAATLCSFIDELDPLPTPWGLKWALEARGMLEATFSQPLSHARQQQGKTLQSWVARWQTEVGNR